jgi:hypothetical protein
VREAEDNLRRVMHEGGGCHERAHDPTRTRILPLGRRRHPARPRRRRRLQAVRLPADLLQAPLRRVGRGPRRRARRVEGGRGYASRRPTTASSSRTARTGRTCAPPRRTSARRSAALRAIEAANPGRLDGIFGDAPWTNKERCPTSRSRTCSSTSRGTRSRWPTCPRTSSATATSSSSRSSPTTAATRRRSSTPTAPSST